MSSTDPSSIAPPPAFGAARPPPRTAGDCHLLYPSLLPSPRRIERIVCVCHKFYLLYNLYNIVMIATKRLAVTESVWAELSDLKRPGETFSQLLEEMIEREKKARLIAHLKKIADEGDFVELPP
jgi:predicted CopG family antitoxin